MCKKEINPEKTKVEIWLQGEYQDKVKALGFNRRPDFCSLSCAISYLSELATLIKEPIIHFQGEQEE